MAVVTYLRQLVKQTGERKMPEASAALESLALRVIDGEFDEDADAEDRVRLGEIMKELLPRNLQ
jgi:hypothetical protein